MANNIKDDDEDSTDAEKTVGGKKTIFIILGVVLLLAGGGAGVYFSGILNKSDGAKEEKTAEAEAPKDGETAEGPRYDEEGNLIGGPVFYEIPSVTVDLNATGRKGSFIKLSITLELANQEAVAIVEANKPRIQDVLTTYLREFRPEDLKGSAGLYRLREELLTRISKAVHPAEVKDILFKDMMLN